MAYLPSTSYQLHGFSHFRSKLIKVENFESYFKKQQADSNCGFAEEYEVYAVSRKHFTTHIFGKATQFSYEAYVRLTEGKRRDLYYRDYLDVCTAFPDSALDLVEVHDKYFTSWTIISTRELTAWPAGLSSRHRQDLLSPFPSHTIQPRESYFTSLHFVIF